MPAYFKTETNIDGIEAVDLFALNTSLGGTIENQVVDTLNGIRKVWDPDDEWLEYRFERRSQSFPDVRLVSRKGGQLSTAVGIELKGWYLLSKEGEPSFRYTVTQNACAENDLLVIVPWRLKNVLSGHPVVHAPYIENARYATEARNHWWTYLRKAKSDPIVIHADGAVPYSPSKSGINDRPVSDQGGNFGRVARLGLPELDQFVIQAINERVAGIEAKNWIAFFKAFTDAADAQQAWKKMEILLAEHFAAREADADRAVTVMRELITLLTEPIKRD
ncbi:MAG: hypothetical protein ACREQN_17795 [Candidatus Binataceae bacterium]